jgi:predicted RNA polymerase sigma factor
MDLAEEAAQEAFAIAAERARVAAAPGGLAGGHRAQPRHRSGAARADAPEQDAVLEADQPAATMDEIDLDDSTIPDERLELIFMCCHPALAVEAQVALTLRALGGLTTEEIARAFLVSEETMKRRLPRCTDCSP